MQRALVTFPQNNSPTALRKFSLFHPQTMSSGGGAFKRLPYNPANSDREVKNALLQQLFSIDAGSEEFSNVLTKLLATQDGVNAAISLQGRDAMALVDILDQVSRRMRV